MQLHYPVIYRQWLVLPTLMLHKVVLQHMQDAVRFLISI